MKQIFNRPIPKNISQDARPSKEDNSFLHSVTKRFLFQYRSCDQELMVEIEAEDLNKAMIRFAERYHQIQEVYEIAELS